MGEIGSLWERIERGRRHLGVSQSGLADLIGCSRQAITDIKDGSSKGGRIYGKIAAVLSCDADWLSTGNGPPPSWAVDPTDLQMEILKELRRIGDCLEAHVKQEDGRWDQIQGTLTTLASGHPAAVGVNPSKVAG